MKEIKIKSKLMFKGSIVSFYRDDVKLEDNRLTKRDVIKYNNFSGSVCALCLNSKNEIICVKQYRHVKKELSLSCVSGYIEKNENPIDAIKREIKEEIGGEVIEIEQIFQHYPLVAYSYEKVYCYVAKIKDNLTKQNLDENENIEIVKLSMDEFIKYANSLNCTSLNFKIFANYLNLTKSLKK